MLHVNRHLPTINFLRTSVPDPPPPADLIPYQDDAVFLLTGITAAGVWVNYLDSEKQPVYLGEVMKFNSGDSSNIALSTDPSGKNYYWFEGYYKPDGSGLHFLVSHHTDTNNRIHLALDNANNKIYVNCSNGSGAYGEYNFSDWGNIHKYKILFNGSGVGNVGRLFLFIDGVQKSLSFTGTVPATIAAGLINHNTGVQAGTYADGIGYEFEEYYDSATQFKYLWNWYDESVKANHGTPNAMDYDWIANLVHKPVYGVVRWANKTTGAEIDVPYADRTGAALNIDLSATHNEIWEAAPSLISTGLWKLVNCRDLINNAVLGIDQTDLSNATYFYNTQCAGFSWYDAGAVDTWSIESILYFMLAFSKQQDKFFINVTLDTNRQITHAWNFALYSTAKTETEQLNIATLGGWLSIYNICNSATYETIWAWLLYDRSPVDLSSNGHSTITNTDVIPYDAYLKLNGSSSRLTGTGISGVVDKFQNQEAVSIFSRISVDTIGTRIAILDFTIQGLNTAFYIEKTAINTILAGGRSKDSDAFQSGTSTNTLAINTYSIIAELDVKNKTVKLWVNGVQWINASGLTFGDNDFDITSSAGSCLFSTATSARYFNGKNYIMAVKIGRATAEDRTNFENLWL